MSARGRMARWRSAIIAVLVTRGSTTITVARLVAQHPGGQQRVVVGHVGPHQQDAVGPVEVGVGAGRAVAAERALVAGGGAGHAQGGVAVVVADAEAGPHQLAQGVELLGDELAGAQHRHRVGAVALHRVP